MHPVTAAEMREIDTLATSRYGISADRLMENAGKAAAAEILAMSPVPVEEFSCVIICGRGNNGGDGLVAARHLLNAKAQARVFIVPPQENGYPTLALRNLKRACLAHVSAREVTDLNAVTNALAKCHIAADALLGTGSSGAPRGIFAELIAALNGCGKPVVSLDLPSGMDPDTGLHEGACVKAAATLMFGLPKTGLLKPQAAEYTGKLKVLDIGFPDELLRRS
ncbi:MAG: NAD(P)H-hydrate epimerase [Elusimicrobiales bacterium]